MLIQRGRSHQREIAEPPPRPWGKGDGVRGRLCHWPAARRAARSAATSSAANTRSARASARPSRKSRTSRQVMVSPVTPYDPGQPCCRVSDSGSGMGAASFRQTRSDAVTLAVRASLSWADMLKQGIRTPACPVRDEAPSSSTRDRYISVLRHRWRRGAARGCAGGHPGRPAGLEGRKHRCGNDCSQRSGTGTGRRARSTAVSSATPPSTSLPAPAHGQRCPAGHKLPGSLLVRA